VVTTKHEFAATRRAERRARRLEEYRRGLRPFAIAAWEISKEHNVGTLVRTAHAAAASEVVLLGEREWNVEAARTADLYTEIVQLPAEIGAFRAHLHERAFNLVAVELAEESTNLFEAVYPERPCFLLGAELGGLPEGVLDDAELVVQIPQWGLVPCLNLAVAGSIVVYDYLAKRHREDRLSRPDGGLVFDSGTPAGEDGHIERE
jgi:tRNA G18 (ribose-2'-O)-methylase SpoU